MKFEIHGYVHFSCRKILSLLKNINNSSNNIHFYNSLKKKAKLGKLVSHRFVSTWKWWSLHFIKTYKTIHAINMHALHSKKKFISWWRSFHCLKICIIQGICIMFGNKGKKSMLEIHHSTFIWNSFLKLYTTQENKHLQKLKIK